MPLPNQPWTTSLPASQDTVGTEQPDLTNDSTPGANDGHRVLVEHVQALRDKLQYTTEAVGDASSLPAGCLKARVTALEGTGSGNVKADATDASPGTLDAKLDTPAVGIAKSVVDLGGGNRQVQLALNFSSGSGAGYPVEDNDARMSNSRAPSGAASGDLGGTYPSPTVAALTVTGPTQLTLGAVADGEVLTRSGSTIVGSTPATSSADTKSPKGTWATTSTVSFGARPGQPSTTLLTLQDGTQRSMTTGTWDISNGVADWGYDEAASQGNTKWLYFYAVPKSGDDTQLVIRASDNAPSTGPTGYSNWKYVWATYIDGSGNLLENYQSGNIFSKASGAGFGSASILQDNAVHSLDLSGLIPQTASIAKIRIQLAITGLSQARFEVWPLGGSSGNAIGRITPSSDTETDQEDAHFEVPTPGTKSVDYRVNPILGTITSKGFTVFGWIDEWIDP